MAHSSPNDGPRRMEGEEREAQRTTNLCTSSSTLVRECCDTVDAEVCRAAFRSAASAQLFGERQSPPTWSEASMLLLLQRHGCRKYRW